MVVYDVYTSVKWKADCRSAVQLNDCLEDLGMGSFGLDLTLKVWKSPELRVLLARARVTPVNSCPTSGCCMQACCALQGTPNLTGVEAEHDAFACHAGPPHRLRNPCGAVRDDP